MSPEGVGSVSARRIALGRGRPLGSSVVRLLREDADMDRTGEDERANAPGGIGLFFEKAAAMFYALDASGRLLSVNARWRFMDCVRR